MKKHPREGAHHRARALRRHLTDAERRVWWIVRAKQIDGHRFRRQVPIGPYIADFACHEARLIIEIDGGHHDPASPQEIERRRFPEGQGYRLLRFWNNDVLQNLEGVWTMISAALAASSPASPPPRPSPIEGEGAALVEAEDR